MIKVQDKHVRHYAKYATTFNEWDKKEVLDNLINHMGTKKHFIDMDEIIKSIAMQIQGQGKSNYMPHMDYRIIDRYIKKLNAHRFYKMKAPFEPIKWYESLSKMQLAQIIETMQQERRLS